MNFRKLAIVSAGVISLAAVPAMTLAHSHHPLRASAPTLMASTTTGTATRTPHAVRALKVKHTSLTSSKRRHSSRVKKLSSKHKTHSTLTHRKHAAVTLSTKRKSLAA